MSKLAFQLKTYLSTGCVEIEGTAELCKFANGTGVINGTVGAAGGTTCVGCCVPVFGSTNCPIVSLLTTAVIFKFGCILKGNCIADDFAELLG